MPTPSAAKISTVKSQRFIAVQAAGKRWNAEGLVPDKLVKSDGRRDDGDDEQLKKTLEDFGKTDAAQAAPKDERVLLSLGHCLVSAQPPRTAEAIASWQQIIKLTPSSPLAAQAQQLIAKYGGTQ